MFATVSSTRRSTRARPGRHLVDRAVQVVDPALQRDGELDEVLPAAADERPLRLPQPADARPGDPGEDEAGRAERRRRRRRRAAAAFPERCTAYDGSEKMTW